MGRKKREQRWEQTSLLDEVGYVEPDTSVSPTDLKGMVRKRDHSTSVAAARAAKVLSTKLKQQIVIALRSIGPMTDYELEILPQFKDCGATTVRKRRVELRDAKPPMVEWYRGEKRPHPKTGMMMKVWAYCGKY